MANIQHDIPSDVSVKNYNKTTGETSHTSSVPIKVPLPCFMSIQLNSKDKTINNVIPFYIHVALTAVLVE